MQVSPWHQSHTSPGLSLSVFPPSHSGFLSPPSPLMPMPPFCTGHPHPAPYLPIPSIMGSGEEGVPFHLPLPLISLLPPQPPHTRLLWAPQPSITTSYPALSLDTIRFSSWRSQCTLFVYLIINIQSLPARRYSNFYCVPRTWTRI